MDTNVAVAGPLVIVGMGVRVGMGVAVSAPMIVGVGDSTAGNVGTAFNPPSGATTNAKTPMP